MAISQLLIQFIFRITFGVALAMAVTPAGRVTSGFYRVHLWVLMGLNTFAVLALLAPFERSPSSAPLPFPALVLAASIGLALLSYVGSVLWLYERPRAGAFCLYLLVLTGLAAAVLTTPLKEAMTGVAVFLAWSDLATSGLLLGTTLSAMFLGHWYLNTPTMELLPLRRLVLLIAAAILARALVCGTGLVLQTRLSLPLETAFWIFIAFRWLAGILASFLLACLAWQTLKVPNTQSATGILYAGVIVTFLGELTSQLLSADATFPL